MRCNAWCPELDVVARVGVVGTWPWDDGCLRFGVYVEVAGGCRLWFVVSSLGVALCRILSLVRGIRPREWKACIAEVNAV